MPKPYSTLKTSVLPRTPQMLAVPDVWLSETGTVPTAVPLLVQSRVSCGLLVGGSNSGPRSGRVWRK